MMSTTPDDENKGGTPSEEGRGRNRKDAGPSATNNKKEWREWINKRVSGKFERGCERARPRSDRERERERESNATLC